MNFEICNKYITFAMRRIIRSLEFDEFYESSPKRVREKLNYALNIIAEIKVVSTKLVKKLIGTDFYELRISTENEWRVIVLAIDDDNFIECENILLLNGFMKKSTKDYGREIKKAQMIINDIRI